MQNSGSMSWDLEITQLIMIGEPPIIEQWGGGLVYRKGGSFIEKGGHYVGNYLDNRKH